MTLEEYNDLVKTLDTVEKAKAYMSSLTEEQKEELRSLSKQSLEKALAEERYFLIRKTVKGKVVQLSLLKTSKFFIAPKLIKVNTEDKKITCFTVGIFKANLQFFISNP